jgi:hypothetical protein
MSTSAGPNSQGESNLILAFDVADSANSYKGQPGTNITTGVNRVFNGYSLSTYSNGKLFETNGYTETTYVPTLGNVSVQSVEIYNVYSGYGTDGNYNCCPSLFQYGAISGISGNTVYTYEIIYKCNSGYTHPNYMYHYEYNGGTYLTEFGVHDDAKRTHLGDGWYHAWNTFTTQPTTNYFAATGLWYYQYNVRDKVSVAKISITQGAYIRPPAQFIPSNTTRSNTQGLLDLMGKNTLDLTNTTYDTNAQISFDGSSGYADVTTSLGVLSQYTIEHVSYKGSNDRMPISSRSGPIFYHYADNSWYYTHGGVAGEYYYPKTKTISGWGYWTITYDGSYVRIYRNGVYEGQQASLGTANWTGGMRIGNYTYGGYTWNGPIAVVKMYNRALTSTEITQNYNQYKTRFNLS